VGQRLVKAFCLYQELRAGFPDLHWEIRNLIEGSDKVESEGIILGTNRIPLIGPKGSLSLTRNDVRLLVFDIWKARDRE
jgi:hypothetical protein